jgi:hypothetical protein
MIVTLFEIKITTQRMIIFLLMRILSREDCTSKNGGRDCNDLVVGGNCICFNCDIELDFYM